MKKLLLLGFVLFFQLGFSQTKLDPNSPVLKGIKLEKINDSKFDYINNAEISWDFSSLNIRGKQISIEVISILDCFNGESASDFKSKFSLLNKENFSVKGSSQLMHLELIAKCFKWRVVVIENNKEQVSDWSYFMFLK
ncbi:hypothetical protein [Flavobacterium sp.]|uniref:hypothetical protein n=1 Tax=Flavobacterium sp. TaxID=239 RepID=UPI0040473EC2